jgi:hypothetical protein
MGVIHMDLIYTNAQKVELGILQSHEFDLAFGSDENDFELTLPRTKNELEEKSLLYIEGTEYGGIIDKIGADTEAKTLSYQGRTWHGILEKKILEPEQGQDYLILEGEANTVIGQIINLIGLSDIFEASSKDSGMTILPFQFERYIGAYTGLRKILNSCTAKLHIEYHYPRVILSAVPYIDYSQDEEWDSSQVAFKIEKDLQPTNHLICLGSRELRDRHVIHLFTDENGGVQDYATVDQPLEDSDYILDKSKQLIFGVDEVVETYDNATSSTTDNYKPLSNQPADWRYGFANYYQQEVDEEAGTVKYSEVKGTASDQLEVTTSKPSDWSTAYSNYYTSNGQSVSAVETYSYPIINKKPSDWATNCTAYYYFYSDGVTTEYKTVEQLSSNYVKVQTRKPTDWATNYGSYYQKKAKGSGYESVPAVKGKAPTWKAKKYYTQYQKSYSPAWKSNYYRVKKTTTSAPTWTSNKYYTKVSVEIAPAWASGAYFYQVEDNYADLVANGLEKLKESYNADTLDVTLDPSNEYDIDDWVGAREEVTGIETSQPITKKIVKISNGKKTITYEIGDDGK